MITLDNCTGQCCSHNRHLGVCAHKYECHHHSEKAAIAAKEESWRAFLNGTGPAPQPPMASILDRRRR